MAGAAQKQQSGDKLVSKNRRAYFDYDVEETLEAGLVLSGSEVRALREGPANLIEAWVDVDRRSEAWVKGMRIATLKHAAFGHEEVRPRKLLLHKEQIEHLRSSVDREGMTLIVTKCYFKNNRVKVEVALARGKKKHDKRQALREKDASREAQAAMRRGRKG
jgi:SsrA-binding protein